MLLGMLCGAMDGERRMSSRDPTFLQDGQREGEGHRQGQGETHGQGQVKFHGEKEQSRLKKEKLNRDSSCRSRHTTPSKMSKRLQNKPIEGQSKPQEHLTVPQRLQTTSFDLQDDKERSLDSYTLTCAIQEGQSRLVSAGSSSDASQLTPKNKRVRISLAPTPGPNLKERSSHPKCSAKGQLQPTDGKERNVVVAIHQTDSAARIVLARDAPYVCGWCGATFTQALTIQDHVVKVHGYVDPPENAQAGQELEDGPEEGNRAMRIENSHNSTTSSAGLTKKNHPVCAKGSESDDHRTNPDSSGSSLAHQDETSTSPSESDDEDVEENANDDDDPDYDVQEDMDCEGDSDAEQFLGDHDVDLGNVPNNHAETNKVAPFPLADKVSYKIKAKSLFRGHPKRGLSSKTFCVKWAPDERRKRSRKRKKACLVQCYLCLEMFPSEEQRQHLAEEHGEYASAAEADSQRPLLSKRKAPSGGDTLPSLPMKCAFCETFFLETTAAEKHLRKHCGAEGVKCDLCLKAIELWNKGRNKELVSLCDAYASTVRDSNRQSRNARVDEGDCEKDICAVTESREQTGTPTERDVLKKSLKDINKVANVDAYLLASCYVCKERFYLRQHRNRHYNSHKNFPCAECEEVLPTLKLMKTHLANVHQSREKCDFCPTKCRGTSRLNDHILGHLGFYQCCVCGAAFMSKKDLVKHVKLVLRNPTLAHVPGSDAQRPQYSSLNLFHSYVGRKVTPVQLKEKGDFPCQFCNKKYRVSHFFHKHMYRCHPEEGFDLTGQSFICDKCGSAFVSQTSLSGHMFRYHSDRFLCPIPGCSIRFANRGKLEAHMKSCTDHQTKKCHVCGKTFEIGQRFERHVARHQRKLEGVKCKFCGKTFPDVTHMKYHEKNNHTMDFEHICEQCGKTFASPYVLKVHLLTHSSERPYKCDYCDKAFQTELYLRAHRRIHTKPFACSQCGEGFAQQGARRTHLLKVHGIKQPLTRMVKPRLRHSDIRDTALDPSSQSIPSESADLDVAHTVNEETCVLGEGDLGSVAGIPF